MSTRGIIIAVVTILIAVSGVRAEDGLGVGVIVGEPTGISIKKWISQEHALDAALAWSFSGNDSFQFHMDYLIHNFKLLKVDAKNGQLPVYFGIGGRVKLKDNQNDKNHNNNDPQIGVRVPFGICYLFAEQPLEIFAEIVPILDVVPDTDFDINAAIGIRYYFR